MIKDFFYSKEGHRVDAVWKQTEDMLRFRPLTQAYGVCFTKDGRVLVAKDRRDWGLPGGTLEEGETPQQALIRELDEEVNIDVLTCRPLGVQKLHYPDNPNKDEGERFYQSRWVVIISKIKPRAPDPCDGRVFKRKFIHPTEFNDYVRWGAVHKEVFRLAHQAFLNWQKYGTLR